MRQIVSLVCAAAAASSAAFTALSDHEIRVTASSPAAKSMNDGKAISQNSNSKRTEEAFAPSFDGLRFIETLVTAHR
uniref:Uncharacterized protein n=1 Tax=Picea sitchensis TaxID=3332 RepID=A9NSV5_PICSI|nr:unknown [Picea sitchensis]